MKKSSFSKMIMFCLVALFIVSATSFAYAAPEEQAVAGGAMDSTSVKAISAALAIGLGAVAAALGMSFAISKATQSIAQQPEAEASIRSSLLLGLVFIETAVIYALVISIMIIFVL